MRKFRFAAACMGLVGVMLTTGCCCKRRRPNYRPNCESPVIVSPYVQEGVPSPTAMPQGEYRSGNEP